MSGRDIGWPLEKVPRGGSESWELPLLRDEFFGAPLPAGTAVGTASGVAAAAGVSAALKAATASSTATSTAAGVTPPLTNNAVKFNDWVDPFCIGDDFYSQGLTPVPAYPLTFVVWAKLHTTPSGGNYGGIFSVEDGGAHSTEFNEIILDSNSNTLVVYDHSGGGTLIGTVGTMTVGTWHKVALRLESGTFSAFIGTMGTPGVTKVTGSLTNVTAPGFAGLGSTMFRVTEWFPGVLSRARLWKAALSDAEIAAEFTTAADAAPDGAIVTSNLFGSWLPPTITLSPSTENVALFGTDLDQIRGGGSLLRTLDTGPTLDPSAASNVGTSAGTGAASGVGASSAASTASSSGAGLATATGASSNAAVASSAGVGAASGTGRALLPSVATSAGAGAAAATGAATFAGVGSASGVALASGVGSTATAGSIASASGIATTSATGASSASTTASGAGVGAAVAVGIALAPAAGTSTATSAATATGRATSSSTGTSSGASSALAVGLALTAGSVGTSAGTSTMLGLSPVVVHFAEPGQVARATVISESVAAYVTESRASASPQSSATASVAVTNAGATLE